MLVRGIAGVSTTRNTPSPFARCKAPNSDTLEQKGYALPPRATGGQRCERDQRHGDGSSLVRTSAMAAALQNHMKIVRRLAILASLLVLPCIAVADDSSLPIIGDVTPSASSTTAGNPVYVSIALRNQSSTPQHLYYYPPQYMVDLCVWHKGKNLVRAGESENGYFGRFNVYGFTIAPNATWNLAWNGGGSAVTSFDTRVFGYKFSHPGDYAIAAIPTSSALRGNPTAAERCPDEAPASASWLKVVPRQ